METKMQNDWENLSVTSIGREPPRTYSMPLASEEDAFSDIIEPPSPFRLSLNGTWKLSWAGNPDLRVRDFWRADFPDADWFEIDVPSCVEMRGFGSPGYTNIRYPHKLEWPLIRDRQSGEADYNPVSSYRRRFSVPESWRGRRVILRFDGVYSAYYVWVNGQKVGYAQDSALPSEFDITRFLVPGENVLAVEVYRWCDGSYLEDQDMFRFSGIFRDVTLWSMPQDGIWDFAVETSLKNECRDAEISVTGCDGAEWSLFDAARREVARGFCGASAAAIPGVALWSAEKPNLYTLVVRKGDDIRARKVGFREIHIDGHTILVNGRKIKFKGVNRHETNPDNGRTISLDDMLRDISLFKQYNIDTVRTSHYPDHHLWYDLCDRYGIYVIAEANVEGHEPSWGEDGLGRFPEWEHSIVERNVRHVLFYRNHPSVVIWSMGNETGHGDCFRKAIAEVKALDSSRPVHWERGNKDADIDGRMYPPVEWLELRGQLGDGPAGIPVPARSGSDETDPDNSSGKVFILTEYAHAMGNAVGNFAEYWDAIYRHESLCGGCIWDWVDQAIWKYTGHVDPATGKPERFLAYGGDFDEQPNDGPFCVNGIVDPFRNVSAKLVEIGHVHRNLVVRLRTTGDPPEPPEFTIENRFGFTDASEFAGEWELLEDGAVAAGGTFSVPPVPPLSSAPLTLPIPTPKPGAEAFLNVRFVLKADTAWAQKGWAVARDQIALTAPAPSSAPAAASPCASAAASPSAPAAASPCAPAVQTAGTIILSAGGTTAEFSRATGTLCRLEMGGITVLSDPAAGIAAGPLLTCFRAFTDNDIWLRGETLEKPGNIYLTGLSQLRYHARPSVIDGSGVRFTIEVTGSKSAGFTHETLWSLGADGSLLVRNTVTPHGTMPAALPRLGTSWRLDPALERMRWYGRGPRENYIDRRTGSFVGIHDSTVTEQYEPYVRPQDCGSKCDVRWVAFAGADGRGVKFSASEPLFVQALHFTAEDLEFARHRNGQQRVRIPLVPRPEVFLNLDIRQLGLGGASCGPEPMQEYIFPIRPESWTVKVEPVRL